MAKDLEVAILFADVVGSTQLYEHLGDTRASETVSRCLEVMKEATYQNDGTVIKTIGDEVMSTFPSVDEAMVAAKQMQTRISSRPGDGQQPVSIRIGCHYGPVVQEHNDIFGAAVHTANRMTSQAKARQIVVSGTTVEHMSPEWRAQTRQIDVATVRGRLDEIALYEVLWQPEEAAGRRRRCIRRCGEALARGRDGRVQLPAAELPAQPSGARDAGFLLHRHRGRSRR